MKTPVPRLAWIAALGAIANDLFDEWAAEMETIEADIEQLISEMRTSIAEADEFLRAMPD